MKGLGQDLCVCCVIRSASTVLLLSLVAEFLCRAHLLLLLLRVVVAVWCCPVLRLRLLVVFGVVVGWNHVLHLGRHPRCHGVLVFVVLKTVKISKKKEYIF